MGLIINRNGAITCPFCSVEIDASGENPASVKSHILDNHRSEIGNFIVTKHPNVAYDIVFMSLLSADSDGGDD